MGPSWRADVAGGARTKAVGHPEHTRARAKRPLEGNNWAVPATQSLWVPTLCAPNIATRNAWDQNSHKRTADIAGQRTKMYAGLT
jgi:hypothetical protein